MKRVIVPFFIAHQGCPHTCIFCDQRTIAGAPAAVPTRSEILARIAAYRETVATGSMEVAFFGGTFTSLPRSVQEGLLAPLQPLLADGELAGVRISTRPDAIDRETAEFLKGRGVVTVELGIQSLDDDVLARAGRGHTVRHAEYACRTLAEAGLQIGLQLMPGLPGDTPAGAVATLRRALVLGPAFLRIYPTLVIAGTELERLSRAGLYTPLTLDDAVAVCKVMLHEARKAGVPVVRIGLQATRELQMGKGVVAGPWHPAFRQKVEGELFYDLAAKLLADLRPGLPIALIVAPSRLSDMTGHNRVNLQRLHDRQGIMVSAVRGDSSLSRDELRIEGDVCAMTGDILKDLDYTGEVAGHAW
jgi:histone acetyltransferase (RNA polymerase elongator complex component)